MFNQKTCRAQVKYLQPELVAYQSVILVASQRFFLNAVEHGTQVHQPCDV